MFALAEWTARNARDMPDRPALLLADGAVCWRDVKPAAGTGPLVASDTAERLAGLAYGSALSGRPFFPVNPALPQPGPPACGEAELLVATSGSTGGPKIVLLSGANLRAHAAASRAVVALGPGDLWLGCMPLFHIGGLMILWRCAEAGATVLQHSGFDAARVLADLHRQPVTHLSLVPAMLARLLDLGGPAPAHLRYCLVGGAALPAALAERALAAGWPLCPTYGMSEACSQVATLVPARPGWHPGSVGKPLPGLDIDVSGGRIRVRGPAVMLGYAGESPTGEWFETSDQGAWDADGNLVVLGRGDDVLISGGENVQPQAVEEVLATCPGVAAAGVSARPDPVWGDLIVAVVVATATDDEMLAWCRDRLPGAMRPREVVRVAALPLNATGKLDRKALRRLVTPPAPAR